MFYYINAKIMKINSHKEDNELKNIINRVNVLKIFV